jgi:hypothetical protein
MNSCGKNYATKQHIDDYWLAISEEVRMHPIDSDNVRDVVVAFAIIAGFWLIVGGTRVQPWNTPQGWSSSCLSHRQRSSSSQLRGAVIPDLPRTSKQVEPPLIASF